MDNYVTFIAGIFRSCRFGAASAHGKANMMQFAHFIESGAITRDDKGYYTIDFEKMKKDIEIIAGEYITLEGDGRLRQSQPANCNQRNSFPYPSKRSGSYRPGRNTQRYLFPARASDTRPVRQFVKSLPSSLKIY